MLRRASSEAYDASHDATLDGHRRRLNATWICKAVCVHGSGADHLQGRRLQGGAGRGCATTIAVIEAAAVDRVRPGHDPGYT